MRLGSPLPRAAPLSRRLRKLSLRLGTRLRGFQLIFKR